MSRKNRTAKIEERRNKVAANLLGGLTYRQMADALNVSLGTIANDVKVILGRWRRYQAGSIEDWVQIELLRLDRATNAIWNEVIEGDKSAIDRLLKIMERRAKLLGLDAPKPPQELDVRTAGALAVGAAGHWAELSDEDLEMVTQNLLVAAGYGYAASQEADEAQGQEELEEAVEIKAAEGEGEQTAAIEEAES